jgi:hypothetical protein
VTFPFRAQGEGELSLRKGEIVEIASTKDGWYEGRVKGTSTRGIFPTSFIRVGGQRTASVASSVAGSAWRSSMRNFKVTRAAPSLSDVVIDEDVSGAQALTHAQLFFISIKLTTVTLAIAAVLAFFLVPSIQGTAQIMAQLRGIQRTAMNYGGDDNAFPAWTWFSEFGASMMTLVLFPLAVSSILYPTVAVRALSKYKLRFGLYIGTAVAVSIVLIVLNWQANAAAPVGGAGRDANGGVIKGSVSAYARFAIDVTSPSPGWPVLRSAMVYALVPLSLAAMYIAFPYVLVAPKKDDAGSKQGSKSHEDGTHASLTFTASNFFMFFPLIMLSSACYSALHSLYELDLAEEATSDSGRSISRLGLALGMVCVWQLFAALGTAAVSRTTSHLPKHPTYTIQQLTFILMLIPQLTFDVLGRSYVFRSAAMGDVGNLVAAAVASGIVSFFARVTWTYRWGWNRSLLRLLLGPDGVEDDTARSRDEILSCSQTVASVFASYLSIISSPYAQSFFSDSLDNVDATGLGAEPSFRTTFASVVVQLVTALIFDILSTVIVEKQDLPLFLTAQRVLASKGSIFIQIFCICCLTLRVIGVYSLMLERFAGEITFVTAPTMLIPYYVIFVLAYSIRQKVHHVRKGHSLQGREATGHGDDNDQGNGGNNDGFKNDAVVPVAVGGDDIDTAATQGGAGMAETDETDVSHLAIATATRGDARSASILGAPASTGRATSQSIVSADASDVVCL